MTDSGIDQLFHFTSKFNDFMLEVNQSDTTNDTEPLDRFPFAPYILTMFNF